jgi:phospholipase C
MLGFSEISGMDAVSGEITQSDGLAGTESNVFNGQKYAVTMGADYRMQVDPAHEFPDVLLQLCGPGAQYNPGGQYPPINNSGFVESYAKGGGGANPGEIMKCYRPAQLPVLNALACEFVVCDRWFASVPGPTWPNRMFVHAASSGGLDHSATTAEIVEWETVAGFSFKNGTIFDALQKAGVARRLYAGDDFPMVSALKGVHLDDIRHYSLFASDVQQPSYNSSYVFIEPSYDVLHDYQNGTSEHPLGDVTRGEMLIKTTYEAIRNSPLWNKSLLIITWDEHGGFYDHVAPPAAPAPGDTAIDNSNNASGFTFERYGARVPAIVVSPLIAKNLVDHRVYDHTSILATVERLYGINPLTVRDAEAASIDALITLAIAREDTPKTLPAPAVDASPAIRPADSANSGNVPGILHAAMRQELLLTPSQQASIMARVAAIQTRADALRYLAEVQHKRRQQQSKA